ncbi:hypothetical protein WJX72_003206 [[Myrmecia] bisecta]|uniref:Glycosyltransferase n=1 Tax=[Myrmecia] bisecta TaxID=41462 RepID=A0AAW1Q8H7_9CHLO
MRGPDRLIVFARHPGTPDNPGLVKTRLAKDIGQQAAASLYKRIAEHTFKQATSLEQVQCVVLASAQQEEQKVVQWLKELGESPHQSPHHGSVSVSSQAQCGDLGARMLQAFEDAFQSGASKVVLVGTDAPGLTASILQAAFDTLNEYEMVLGPAVDGGYYLIGLTRPLGCIFKDIEWSTRDVLEHTLVRAQQSGVRVSPSNTLPTLQDIDTLQDLKSWVANPANAQHEVYEAAKQGLQGHSS